MNRCYWEKGKDYKNYGGRGIKVCDEWHNPLNFKLDMQRLYKKGLSLDRIDNNKGYSKENCRWVTRKIQNNNTRKNHLFEFNGIKRTLTEWSDKLGIKRSTLAQRIYVYHWSINKSFEGRESI